MPSPAQADPTPVIRGEIIEDDVPFEAGADIFGGALGATPYVSGEHRVIVHTMLGQAKRGRIRDADLEAPQLEVHPMAGGASEAIAVSQISAVFFVLEPGEQPPTAQGRHVAVRFPTGREIRGFADEGQEGSPGFFLVPDDARRTNVSRIFVYHHGAKLLDG